MRPLFDGPVFRGNGTRVGGGGGLVDNGGNTPTFASNYGSHDGTSCSFETGNGCIAWISKFGLNNSDAADAFLRSLDPTPIIEQDEFRNPINDTDGKLNNVYLVFFDKDLTESEANDFISRPITEFDPDYNPDSSGGPPPSPSTDLALNQITYTRNGSTWTKEQNILDSDFPVRFTSIEKPIQTFTTFGGWTSISVDVLASDYTDPDIVGWDSWLSKYGSSRGREQNFPWSIEVLASDGSRKHLYFGSCNCQGGIVSHISTDDTLHHICEPDESGEIGSFYLYENTRGAGHVFPETSLNPIAGIYGRDTAIEDGDQVIITMWNDGIDISSVFG